MLYDVKKALAPRQQALNNSGVFATPDKNGFLIISCGSMDEKGLHTKHDKLRGGLHDSFTNSDTK